MARSFLTEEMWERLAPMLPPERGGTGRPQHAHRPWLEAIFWKHRTGAPWRDLPGEFGSWKSIYCQFNRWSKVGLWQCLLEALRREADAEWLIRVRHAVENLFARLNHFRTVATRSKSFLLSLAGKIQPQMPLETDEDLALRQHPSLLWPLMKGIIGILLVSCKATKLQNLAFDPERLRSLVAYYVLAFATVPSRSILK